MYEQEEYSRVVLACRDAHSKTDIALVAGYCFYAACRKRIRSDATRWFLVQPLARHKQLTIDCKKLGNLDVGVGKLDCERNALDCR
jgi:hypothetical protein